MTWNVCYWLGSLGNSANPTPPISAYWVFHAHLDMRLMVINARCVKELHVGGLARKN